MLHMYHVSVVHWEQSVCPWEVTAAEKEELGQEKTA